MWGERQDHPLAPRVQAHSPSCSTRSEAPAVLGRHRRSSPALRWLPWQAGREIRPRPKAPLCRGLGGADLPGAAEVSGLQWAVCTCEAGDRRGLPAKPRLGHDLASGCGFSQVESAARPGPKEAPVWAVTWPLLSVAREPGQWGWGAARRGPEAAWGHPRCQGVGVGALSCACVSFFAAAMSTSCDLAQGPGPSGLRRPCRRGGWLRTQSP